MVKKSESHGGWIVREAKQFEKQEAMCSGWDVEMERSKLIVSICNMPCHVVSHGLTTIFEQGLINWRL